MEIAVFADEIEGSEGKRREEKERVEEKKDEGGGICGCLVSMVTWAV